MILAKLPIFKCQKWHFGRPNLKTDSKKTAKHPPKWWIRHLIHAFFTFWWVLSQFLKIVFLDSFRAIFPAKWPGYLNHLSLMKTSTETFQTF